MGCKWNKTGAVFPTKPIQLEKQASDNAAGTRQNDPVILGASPERVEPKPNQNIKSEQSSSKLNSFPRQLQRIDKSDSNNVEPILPRQASSVRSISAGTLKPNVNEEISPYSRAPDSKTEVQWRTTKKNVVEKVIISKNTEETVLDDTYDESDGSDFHYGDVVSSSSSWIDPEKTALRQDTFSRFNSALPKQHSTQQGTFFDGISNGSDESYPLHDSIVTSTPSDLEISSAQPKTNGQSTPIDRQSSSIRKNRPAREAIHHSDETDSYFEGSNNAIASNSKKTMVHRGAMIESRSPNLNKSDSQQAKTVYETSSNCSEF